MIALAIEIFHNFYFDTYDILATRQAMVGITAAIFLIYYIISTIGEKSVKAGNVSIIFGMWIAIIVLTPIGLFLSYKAATDSAIFDVELYKRVLNKLIKRKAT